MKKLLTLALALVMAAGFSTAASAVELSGDILIRGEAYNNVNDWSDDAGNADRFTAQRTSLNIDANPTDGVTVHVGLEAVNIWGASVQHCGGSEIVGPGLESVSYNCSDYSGTPKVFEAYIVAADLFGSGVTAKVGKQQINFGAERIIGTDHAWALHPTTFDAWAFVVPAGPATIVLADVKLSEIGRAHV